MEKTVIIYSFVHFSKEMQHTQYGCSGFPGSCFNKVNFSSSDGFISLLLFGKDGNVVPVILWVIKWKILLWDHIFMKKEEGCIISLFEFRSFKLNSKLVSLYYYYYPIPCGASSLLSPLGRRRILPHRIPLPSFSIFSHC